MMDDVVNPRPYENLTPEVVLDAVESVGFRCDMSLLALNSYENRVYQVGIEDAKPVVVKFYRPGRWSAECIQEEHDFVTQLAELEIPAVPPWRDVAGQSLHVFAGYYFGIYPRRGGRAPEIDDPNQRAWIGRFMGRIHALGGVRSFMHRPSLSPERLGHSSVQYLVQQGFVSSGMVSRYKSVADRLLVRIEEIFARVTFTSLRLHGDCHLGNILWTDDGPHFVDFDDACTGPAVQDLWMLLAGSRDQRMMQLYDILDGYSQFHEFDGAELALVEPLRTLRMMHYAAWLARRWDDPAFPPTFTWFNTEAYWHEHIAQLEEQLAALDEPPMYW
jgi:Ser/Thr protein kinase RdoA (MazF antagonist)